MRRTVDYWRRPARRALRCRCRDGVSGRLAHWIDRGRDVSASACNGSTSDDEGQLDRVVTSWTCCCGNGFPQGQVRSDRSGQVHRLAAMLRCSPRILRITSSGVAYRIPYSPVAAHLRPGTRVGHSIMMNHAKMMSQDSNRSPCAQLYVVVCGRRDVADRGGPHRSPQSNVI